MRTARPHLLMAALASAALLTSLSPAGAQTVHGPGGPKKRVAVAKFDAHGAFVAAYGGWDIGGGLAAQLATELMRTGRFIVLERAELASVLREQEMGLTKILNPETAPPAGRVTGAQFLIRGAVTEFEERKGGGGLRLGFARGPFGGALGGSSASGVVGIDLRVIDTTTGQVVHSFRAAAETSQGGLTADFGYKGFAIGGDQFEKTVLGQATRQAIAQAVQQILQATEPVPWSGQVVEVNDTQAILNAGANEDLRPGDVLTVSGVVKELTDPATGEVLAKVEDVKGQVVVEQVHPKYSVAKMSGYFPVQRGDLVRFGAVQPTRFRTAGGPLPPATR